MTYKSTRRSWVKLWTHEWLRGSTRFELSAAERGVWADFLAMAGDSRYPGVIAAGKNGNGYIGYPPKYLCNALNINKKLFQRSLKRFKQVQKIEVFWVDAKLLVIQICAWETYQSEYQRQAKYRKKDDLDNNKLQQGLQQELQAELHPKLHVEGEGEVEEEEEGETPTVLKCARAHTSKSKKYFTQIIEICDNIYHSHYDSAMPLSDRTDEHLKKIQSFMRRERDAKGNKLKTGGALALIACAFEVYCMYKGWDDMTKPEARDHYIFKNNHGFGSFTPEIAKWVQTARKNPEIYGPLEKPSDVLRLNLDQHEAYLRAQAFLKRSGENKKEIANLIRRRKDGLTYNEYIVENGKEKSA